MSHSIHYNCIKEKEREINCTIGIVLFRWDLTRENFQLLQFFGTIDNAIYNQMLNEIKLKQGPNKRSSKFGNDLEPIALTIVEMIIRRADEVPCARDKRLM